MKKIVIACDSFKGSLSSMEVAECAERGILPVFPSCRVLKIPVADGGEGTVEAILHATGGKYISCPVHDPLMRRTEARYGIMEGGHVAVIEMAAASGLSLLREEERDPWETTTYGTGELIADALRRGCREIRIGIGGSATNDAGTGMLQALGFRFLDKEGNEPGQGGRILRHIRRADSSRVMPEALEARYVVMTDVQSLFYGPQGAAQVFARQKGAGTEMVERLDEGLRSFAAVIAEQTAVDVGKLPGSGAAGGMGGGLVAFLHASLVPGIDTILDMTGFEEQIKDADLLITGEGKLDRQTLMGKAPAGILARAAKHNIPVIAIAGSVEGAEELARQGFAGVFSVLPSPVTLRQAMDKAFAGENVSQTVGQLMRVIRAFAPAIPPDSVGN